MILKMVEKMEIHFVFHVGAGCLLITAGAEFSLISPTTKPKHDTAEFGFSKPSIK